MQAAHVSYLVVVHSEILCFRSFTCADVVVTADGDRRMVQYYAVVDTKEEYLLGQRRIPRWQGYVTTLRYAHTSKAQAIEKEW